MPSKSWHTEKDDHSVTIARRVPVRFDLSVETQLPTADKLRVAHQVRQDLWRVLQKQRGFSPVVRVSDSSVGLTIRAGGQCDAPFPRAILEERVADVLADRQKRDRWVRFASKRRDRSHV